MECKIVEDIANGSPVEAERIFQRSHVEKCKCLTIPVLCFHSFIFFSFAAVTCLVVVMHRV